MPVPQTTEELLQLLRKSELIEPARLDAFLAQPQAQQAVKAGVPRDLVKYLLATSLITQFQGEQLLQGKWRGFTIGKYRVLERIGSGGMGTVYLCEHMVVGRRVAVKVLPTSQADNPSALGRFYREARAAGVLDHPNLVKAHDVDQDGGLHFLVMDYVDGSSLQEIVTRFGPLSPDRAAHYIRQAALGLQHAHQSGLIHRDIKPANILLERNGVIRVLDLGLARFYYDNTDMLTLQYDERNVLGTADYVAPEQALNSHEVDTRADVYSLGATFYFCLTGQPPFPGGKVAQKLIWHQVRQPTPVRQLRADVPEGVVAVLERMMAKNPEERYQTPQDVADALASWAGRTIPLPSEEEMPRLSPAAGATTTNTPLATPRGSSASTPRRFTTTPAMPIKVDTAGRVGTLDRTPAVADPATPRSLGTQTPTKKDCPRPPEQPLAPSRLLERTGRQIDQARERPAGSARSFFVFLILAVLSAAAGTALWWFGVI